MSEHPQRPVAGRRWWRPPEQTRRGWVGLAVVALLMLLSPRTGTEAPGDLPFWTGLAALVAAAGQVVALLWRRRRPEASAAVVLALYAATVLLVGLVLPVTVWLSVWTLAAVVAGWGRALRAAAVATAVLIGLLALGDLARSGPGGSSLLIGLSVVVGLASVLVRSERGRLEAVRQATVAEERLRIARDLHDLVGHGLSAVAVQSSTARLALGAGDEATALTALSAVESSSRTAMREMRQLLGILTSTGSTVAVIQPAQTPAPGLADLPALVERLRAGGVAATWQTDVDPSTVSPETQLCVYRVAQESLTNSVKHAPGAVVAVSVRRVGQDGIARLRLRVESGATPGREAAGDVSRRHLAATYDRGGAGIDGIHARVAAAGGSVTVADSGTGWLVEAHLPLAPEEPQ